MCEEIYYSLRAKGGFPRKGGGWESGELFFFLFFLKGGAGGEVGTYLEGIKPRGSYNGTDGFLYE